MGEGVLRRIQRASAAIRVVTLWRPWDYAISQRDKRVENRGWRAPVACPWFMAVRGGKTWKSGAFEDQPREGDWPAGYVSCVAEVIRYESPCESTEDRWRHPESWGWVLGRVATLPEPILWPPAERHPEDKRTMQGLVSLVETYEYDAALLRALRLAWRRAVVEDAIIEETLNYDPREAP